MEAKGSPHRIPFSSRTSNFLYGSSHLLILTLSFALYWAEGDAYFADWGDIGRAQEPTCVDIPKNMSLCSNIQYERMRLPNLLAHDTLTEVAHQSASWVPLLNIRCHPDTQLFLCSLFTPVCLERPIYPCRSLCSSVQTACEKRMTAYGYHWPDMLKCDNFPEDNDMCLKALHSESGAVEGHQQTASGNECEICQPVPTYENILDNFCRADFVLRAQVKGVRGNKIIVRNARVYKPMPSTTDQRSEVRSERRALRKPRLTVPPATLTCCSQVLSDVSVKRYLIMGVNSTEGLVPTFVLPWLRQKSIRDAIRIFGGLDCSDPSLFTPDTHSGVILNTPRASGSRQKGRNGGRRGGDRRRNGSRTNSNLVEEMSDDGSRGVRRRNGAGREGEGRRGRKRKQERQNKKSRMGQPSNDQVEEVQDRSTKKQSRQNGGRNERRRNRTRDQRLGRQEKERRKEFIRRKIEQSKMEGNQPERNNAAETIMNSV
ncbi:secreted frizzled-related protein 2 isoform X2 [Hyalella azteca]|uniref:Secreted frizzled-related protein 2 isoform X2 n=1 Tax=Hyalella azteca TaxID=294128 RepID=A0A8B7PHT7_HYAAZ|nr:secreted frizzled-related protein 2 isoform X2 [Hyalella azteca]